MAEIIADGVVIVKDWEKLLSSYLADAARVIYPGEIHLLIDGAWNNISECKKYVPPVLSGGAYIPSQSRR